MRTQRVVEYDQEGAVVNDTTVNVETSPQEDNYDTIQQAARQALAANRTFLAIATPTAAQNAAQAKALTRQMNGVIRLLLTELDGTD